MENKIISQCWRLMYYVLIVVFVSIFYKALTNPPPLGDSSAYHIPIAHSFLNGSLFHPKSVLFDLWYYPGASNALLVPFILLNIDLNLFNIVGWIVLFISCFYLARAYKLEKNICFVIAGIICALLSVVRGMDTQSIDILMGAYIALTIGLLKKKIFKDVMFLYLGVLFGMIIGSKYSGPAYAAIIGIVFLKDWIKAVNVKRLIYFTIPLIILGGFWYIRNFFLTGNPFYPGKFLSLPSNPDFHLQEWTPLKTLLSSPKGTGLFVQSLFSEYLFVSSLLIVVPVLLWKMKGGSDAYKLTIIGLLSFLVYLFLPSWPENIVSDLRYNYGVFIPLILSIFLLLKQTKYFHILIFFSLINFIYILSYLGNQPKVYLIAGIIFICLYSVQKIRKILLL